MTEFAFEFRLEQNELRFVILRQYLLEGGYAITVVLPLLPAWIFISQSHASGINVVLALVISYLVIVPLRLWRVVVLSIRNSGPLVKEPRHYEFGPEKLRAVQHSVDASNEWSVYSGLKVTKRFLYLEIRGTKRSIAIPKRVFATPDDCAKFVEAVSGWIAAARPGTLAA